MKVNYQEIQYYPERYTTDKCISSKLHCQFQTLNCLISGIYKKTSLKHVIRIYT